jgi:hypothetical protein
LGSDFFVGLSVVYGFGQYSFLEMVKSKNKEKPIKRKHFNVLKNIATIVRYVLLAILVLVVLKVERNKEQSNGHSKS